MLKPINPTRHENLRNEHELLLIVYFVELELLSILLLYSTILLYYNTVTWILILTDAFDW